MSDDQRQDNKGETNGKNRHAAKPKTLYTDNGDEFNVRIRIKYFRVSHEVLPCFNTRSGSGETGI
jgi:hypothetical protein